MTDYAADAATSSAGTAITTRTGTAAADTVPAGAYVIWKNSGAGAHVVTLTNSLTNDGLATSNRTISLAAGQTKGGPVNSSWGDANGRVAVAIDATAAEVTYQILSRL